jgi:hypothetical protein
MPLPKGEVFSKSTIGDSYAVVGLPPITLWSGSQATVATQ